MIKKGVIILILLLMAPINIHAKVTRNIEIFNISQEKVVKLTQSNSKIQKSVVNYLNEITGVYAKYNPIPNNGYALKIPLQPSVKIQHKWLDTVVDEVIIMIPENHPPFLLVFENDTNFVCFTFKGDVDLLLKRLIKQPNATE